MPDWLIVVIIIAAVILVALLVIAAAKRGRTKRIEHQREKSQEHRLEAQTRAQRAGEAEVAARRAADEAKQERERAVELDRKAAEVDPDTPGPSERKSYG